MEIDMCEINQDDIAAIVFIAPVYIMLCFSVFKLIKLCLDD